MIIMYMWHKNFTAFLGTRYLFCVCLWFCGNGDLMNADRIISRIPCCHIFLPPKVQKWLHRRLLVLPGEIMKQSCACKLYIRQESTQFIHRTFNFWSQNFSHRRRTKKQTPSARKVSYFVNRSITVTAKRFCELYIRQQCLFSFTYFSRFK